MYILTFRCFANFLYFKDIPRISQTLSNKFFPNEKLYERLSISPFKIIQKQKYPTKKIEFTQTQSMNLQYL